MKGQFEFYGLKAPVRREITKPFLVREYLPKKEELTPMLKALWSLPQREYQMFAMDLAVKYVKQWEENDIALLEHLVINKSWWDTVDFVAYKLVGSYFKLYPAKRDQYVQKWLDSGNMWLQRTAILFQLKYKDQTDIETLSHCITSLLGSKEFFINKAIGWILREYSRTKPQWVIHFVSRTKLQPLSEREALRLLN